MYGDHYSDHHSPAVIKPGYEDVKTPGKMDSPSYNPPAPLPFAPAWRENVDKTAPHVVTDNKYFDSALDDLNINAHHSYYNWRPVAEALRQAFVDVYGKNGTKTPVAKMPECQEAFIAVARAAVADFLEKTDQHTVEKRMFYRGMIQELTWARKGTLKP